MTAIVLKVCYAVKQRLLKNLRRCRDAGMRQRYLIIVNLLSGRSARTTATVRRALGAYRFNEAAGALYQFLWHEYCDWYLEWSKLTLYRGTDAIARARAQATLVGVLEETLRLLHPFMPFLTEEIWQRLPRARTATDSIMVARYPRIRRRDLDHRPPERRAERSTRHLQKKRRHQSVAPGKEKAWLRWRRHQPVKATSATAAPS